MANWQSKLDLRDVWGTEDISVISGAIHKRMKELLPEDFLSESDEEERQRLVDEFEMMKESTDVTFDEFNDLFEELYDWADRPISNDWPAKKICWIHTEV